MALRLPLNGAQVDDSAAHEHVGTLNIVEFSQPGGGKSLLFVAAVSVAAALLVNGIAAHTLQTQLEDAPLLVEVPPTAPATPRLLPIVGIEAASPESESRRVAPIVADADNEAIARHHEIHAPPPPAPQTSAAMLAAPAARKAPQTPQTRQQPGPAPTKPREATARTYTIDRQAIKTNFKKASDVFGHGRYLPYQQNGVRRGLQFVDIAPGGIFAQLGFQTGDVVLSVNGVALNTQQDVLANFDKMRKMHTLNLALKRRGELLNFRYILK